MKSNRKAHHSREFKDSIIKRLNRIEGQIRGIKKMIENDCYCDEILNQITSTRSALAGVQEKLLNEHIKTCVVERIKEQDLNVIEEVTSTIRRIIK
ncbi:MAG: metal-sensing transcriptional repressor [Exilispira sp.]|jgi:DNA-binding FrmR family transcriptional regulator|nr:metal-sensing transcriptional repressor [Exilispira sp.]